MSLRRDNFRLAYRSLQAAKARSFLTMLGIVIGVMAVALVVCIGQGVKQQIAGQLARYGKGVFLVQPGAGPDAGGILSGLAGTSSTLLMPKDLQTVQKTSGVAAAVPLATVSGSVTGDATVQSPFILATTPAFADVIQQPMQEGGFLSEADDVQAAVLGMNAANQLFPHTDPLGQALAWHGQRFIVAGVFNDFQAPPLSLEANFNDAVFIPYGVAQKTTGSILGMYQIVGKAAAGHNAGQVRQAVNAALLKAHDGSQDVTVAPAGAAGTASDRTIHLLTVLVAGTAIIALIVGGVGIMDVMLVSVTERMYEIGLRKAIGATNRQIMRQFIVEAFVLSALGALIGLALSCAAVGLLRAFTSLQAVLVWPALIAAPVLAVAISMLFGSMPALKAARKDPIEALRHD